MIIDILMTTSDELDVDKMRGKKQQLKGLAQTMKSAKQIPGG